jgi:hypothetical protein
MVQHLMFYFAPAMLDSGLCTPEKGFTQTLHADPEPLQANSHHGGGYTWSTYAWEMEYRYPCHRSPGQKQELCLLLTAQYRLLL